MILYNKMINPITNFPIKGVIWYQGESNAGPKDALEYEAHFKNMITDWRKTWGVGDFPFLFVQLANFMPPSATPQESSWATLRNSQSAALSLPNTGMASAIDLGDADDIHPRNKQDVGKRLAYAAQAIAYDKAVMYQGPTFESAEIQPNKVLITFKHNDGLKFKTETPALQQYAVAGADKKFYWATPEIVQGKVLLTCSEVATPVYVRYAHADNPDQASLVNAYGFPAVPFDIEIE